MAKDFVQDDLVTVTELSLMEALQPGCPLVEHSIQESTVELLLSALESFSDEVASRPNLGDTGAPLKDIAYLNQIGLLTASFPKRFGGLGLGTVPGCHLSLLRVMTLIGGADLALGRLIEGHISAIILISSYGSETQLQRAYSAARQGMLFGVWNTGGQEAMRLGAQSDGYILEGIKTFASGAAFVRRPIVTADWPDHGWQMTLPRMESSAVARRIKINHDSWEPMGMVSSESYSIDFTDAKIAVDDLIGEPGDFYRDPLFRGGAIRFAAVHAGAVIRLHRLFASWLDSKGRANDPYQVARLGEVAIRSQAAVLWVERAAAVAEQCLHPTADKLATERMLECANMTRVAVEELATSVMQRVIAGVGAHGLLRPSPFEKIIRDLTMYLRQPSPDQALADVGRVSVRKNNLRIGGAENFFWKDYVKGGSLPSGYFKQIYARSKDPWNFETSQYESDKYLNTLNSLPHTRYHSALEIGSSIGIFTQMLAKRCDTLLSVDTSERALELARSRCASEEHVRFVQLQLPGEFPSGNYNLIVLSEVAYYWSCEDLGRCGTILASRQSAGDHLVLVHLTTPVADYPLTGDEVHDALLMRPEWHPVRQERHECYRIDVIERCADLQPC